MSNQEEVVQQDPPAAGSSDKATAESDVSVGADSPATGTKRPSDDTSNVKQAKFKDGKSKVKPHSEISTFRKYPETIFTQPGMNCVVRMVDKHVEAWRLILDKNRLNPNQVKSVLLALFRNTFNAWHTAALRKKFTGIGFHTDDQESELPTMLARLITAYGPKEREGYPTLFISLQDCLADLDDCVQAAGYTYAQSMEIISVLPMLMHSVAMRCGQWVMPMKGSSLLHTGVYDFTPQHMCVVSCTGGNRREELLAGFMQIRVFEKRHDMFVPQVVQGEVNAYAALISYTASTEFWTTDIFDRDLFHPIIMGQKALTA
jgi:hypothetical protein